VNLGQASCLSYELFPGADISARADISAGTFGHRVFLTKEIAQLILLPCKELRLAR
jgi:hypothetical protein